MANAHRASPTTWKPGMPVPCGYYRSPMYPDMIFRQRTDCLSVMGVYSRYDTPRIPHRAIINEPYAAEAKRLASEDAARYGSAAWSRKWREYFEWRQSIGNAYYDELERLYPSAANDNYRPVKAAA